MEATWGEFTWTNCSNIGNLVRSKIDTTLTNEEWKEKWSMMMIVESYKWGTSDHVEQLIKIRTAFNTWFEKAEIKLMVKEAWRMTYINGNPLFRLIKKLARIKLELKQWAISNEDRGKARMLTVDAHSLVNIVFVFNLGWSLSKSYWVWTSISTALLHQHYSHPISNILLVPFFFCFHLSSCCMAIAAFEGFALELVYHPSSL